MLIIGRFLNNLNLHLNQLIPKDNEGSFAKQIVIWF